MPSMTSTAVTQANQDNQIQTVTIRGRRDEGQSECNDNRKVIKTCNGCWREAVAADELRSPQQQ